MKLTHQHERLILHDFFNMEVGEKGKLHIGSLDSSMLSLRRKYRYSSYSFKDEYCMELVKHSFSGFWMQIAKVSRRNTLLLLLSWRLLPQ